MKALLAALWYRRITQAEAVASMKALAPLPEADRMTTRAKTWPKPKTFAAWKKRHCA